MPWRAIAAVAVTVLTALAVWMYARDRGGAVVREPAMIQASLDADEMLNLVAPRRTCTGRCRAGVLGRRAGSTWRIRLTGPSWQRCFDVDVSRFGYSVQRGVSGITAVPCPRVA